MFFRVAVAQELRHDYDPLMTSRASLSVGPKIRIALLASLIIFLLAVISFAGKPADKDYISYWSAAHLAAQHVNPYGEASVLSIEKAQGYRSDKPLIMRNPPWMLVLIAPLRFIGPRLGLVVWMASIFFCLFLCFRWLHVSSEDRLLAYCFAPLYACISAGQSSALLLLGVVMFFVFSGRRSTLAGAGLTLMALKPHLFLILFPIILIDCLRRKFSGTLVAFFSLIAACSVFAYLLDPQAWSQYAAMLKGANLDGEFLQTPACLLRSILAPKQLWFQFVPAAFALAWACWYYVRHQHTWRWLNHGALLLLVSIIVSPYGWLTDEIVLLPGVLALLTCVSQEKVVLGSYLAVNGIIFLLLFIGFQLSSGAYIWTSITWGGWYLYSRKAARVRSTSTCLRSDAIFD